MVLHSKTRRRRKQRVAAGATANDLGSEVPNLGVARALFVILLLHVGAVVAIFLHNRITSDEPVVEKSTVQQPGGAGGGSGGSPGGASGAPLAMSQLPQVEQGEDYYFVATGDTYERVAELKGVDVGALRELNNDVPLRAGRILRLPPPGAVASVPADRAAEIVRAATPAPRPPEPARPPRSVADVSKRVVAVDAPKEGGVEGPVEGTLEAPLDEPEIARAVVIPEGAPAAVVAVKVRPRVSLPVATAGASAVAGSGTSYTVQAGDTVWSIAHRHKISQDDLLRLNGISDPRKLRVGLTLKIPSN